jgi:mono/diheme cytochrome c family protein
MAAVMVGMALTWLLPSSGRAADDEVFTEEFLSDPESIAIGKTLWADQCAFCHGKKAYPGKAPKLKPKKYKPEFVYKRVTKGFRGMPAWAEVYSDEELRGVVAYVLSKRFSP